MSDLSYTSSLIYVHGSLPSSGSRVQVAPSDGGSANISGVALPSRFRFLGVSAFWDEGGLTTAANESSISFHNGDISTSFLSLNFGSRHYELFKGGLTYVLKDCSYLITDSLFFSLVYTDVSTKAPEITVYYQ